MGQGFVLGEQLRIELLDDGNKRIHILWGEVGSGNLEKATAINTIILPCVAETNSKTRVPLYLLQEGGRGVRAGTVINRFCSVPLHHASIQHVCARELCGR